MAIMILKTIQMERIRILYEEKHIARLARIWSIKAQRFGKACRSKKRLGIGIKLAGP